MRVREADDKYTWIYLAPDDVRKIASAFLTGQDMQYAPWVKVEDTDNIYIVQLDHETGDK